MNDTMMRMLELGRQGFYCSQILLILALEAQGKENPDLVRAMAGLSTGMGDSGKACGTLTGGACLLALYAGRGTAEEQEDPRLNPMINELVERFEHQCRTTFNCGIDCCEILQDDPRNRMSRCPQLVLSTLEKAKEILAAHDIDFSGAAD